MRFKSEKAFESLRRKFGEKRRSSPIVDNLYNFIDYKKAGNNKEYGKHHYRKWAYK